MEQSAVKKTMDSGTKSSWRGTSAYNNNFYGSGMYLKGSSHRDVAAECRKLEPMSLCCHRWIKRVTAWHPEGHRRVGRPKYRWDSMLENFGGLIDVALWERAAMDDDL